MQELLGQDRALEILQRQLASGRLHHAYVFHGPAGVGKFTAALDFARILLCPHAQADLAGRFAACGSCPSCGLFDPAEATEQGADDDEAALHAAHPDLHVITKELARYSDDRETRNRKLTQIPVNVLSENLLEPVGRQARMGHGKVFVVDEAELLNPTGQNLLLKTLEEPPAGTTLILVTASEDRLLPTIRSRCQRVAFVPLADEHVAAWLGEHHAELDEAERELLVAFAGGSIGRAAMAARFGLGEWARTILPAMEKLAEGEPQPFLGQQMAERIDHFASTWVDAHANASKEAANHLSAEMMWSLLAGWLRRRLEASAHRCDPGDPLAADAALEPWVGGIDALQHVQSLLSANVNLSLACDQLASRLARELGG